MTRLVARLVLAMLILPASGALFVLMMAVLVRSGPPDIASVLVIWGAMYLFDGLYWVLLWKDTVRWTTRRKTLTIASAPAAILFGVFVGLTIVNPARLAGAEHAVARRKPSEGIGRLAASLASSDAAAPRIENRLVRLTVTTRWVTILAGMPGRRRLNEVR